MRSDDPDFDNTAWSRARGASLKVELLTSDSKWEAENTIFLVTLYNFQKSGGVSAPPPPPSPSLSTSPAHAQLYFKSFYILLQWNTPV